MVPFPFSDLSHSKLRPALILANTSQGDILAQITSRPYADPHSIEIRDQDFLVGSLQVTSYVRPGKLFTANQGLIKAEVGKLKSEVFSKIIQRVVATFNSSVAT
ncbi:MAG: type II toxin-antitoxin system PemK/MazF family toxin [Gammaproteobacteria bacterium]